MRTRGDIKIYLRLFELLLFLFIYIHLCACCWWLNVSLDKAWIPPCQTVFYPPVDIYAEWLWTQYWISFYYSAFMLVGGEIYPRKIWDALMVSILITFGTLLTSTLFGQIAVLVSNLNFKSKRFKELQDSANTSMKNMKLPEVLQIKISNYLVYTAALLDNQ